jgi:hypothetical protein
VKTTGAKNIITSEQTLRFASERAEVIIIIPRNLTGQVLGLHIKSDKPQPGTNVYTWELLTAVMGLHLTIYMPSAVMSAIIRLNDAMLALHDAQSHITACVLGSSYGYGHTLRRTNVHITPTK